MTAIGGLVGLIVSLLYLAKQTKAAVDQVHTSNTMAGNNALEVAMSNLRDIYFKMLEYPGMRAYFYEAKPTPDHDPERERVLILAELLADALECGLMSTRRIPESESYEDWRDFCQFMLAHSPSMRLITSEHPMWWPGLVAL
ncbi:hypothetical protein ACFWP7_04885 [Streptomyces sp. NPDC058470]|uniref:hypothetical protein n=1 Tax=Streptomyces sp. NPDC058470 TaxID=3346515 RepID=UPI00365BEEA0